MKNKSSLDRKFLLLWLGQLISSIGSGLTAFALGVYVFELTHSAQAVSLVMLCSFLPMIMLSPLAGVLADRYDRRLMMMLGDGGSALGLIYILFILAAGEAAIWQICAGAALSSVFSSLTDPAYRATITDLLTKDQYAKASGLVQLAGSSKYLLSPVIAGLLLGFIDISVILMIDICTLAVTVMTASIVRKAVSVQPKTNAKHSPLIKELWSGWHTISSVKGILVLTLLLTLITFFMGLLETLFTPLVLPLSNTKILGIVESVSASGLLAGSLFIGMFNLSRSYSAIMAVALFFTGLFYAFLGVSTNVTIIACAGFLFFAALPFVNTCAEVLIRSNIPNEAQGRAWGLIGFITQLGYVGAFGSAGVLADRVFDPMFKEGGVLADVAGRVIGTGAGRGIGFMLIISGMMVMALALIALKDRSIRSLQVKEEA